MDDDEPPPDALFLAEAGRYPRLSEARERGLVVSAMERPHWIQREGNDFILRVEAAELEAVRVELATYETERRDRPLPPAAEPPAPPLETFSLYIAGLLMSIFWLTQNLLPPGWLDRGEASSIRIIRHGEWWRTLTALTLHGDIAHLVTNMATGLLFAALLLSPLGAGFAWLAIVLSGALGNLMNAAFYARETHDSIGASTAVFGALGLLVGGEFYARFASAHTRTRWQLVLPIGAGLAFLAYLGVGDGHDQIDFMAHLWGFLAGILLGLCAGFFQLKKRASPALQTIAALTAPAMLVLAWSFALRSH